MTWAAVTPKPVRAGPSQRGPAAAAARAGAPRARKAAGSKRRLAPRERVGELRAARGAQARASAGRARAKETPERGDPKTAPVTHRTKSNVVATQRRAAIRLPCSASGSGSRRRCSATAAPTNATATRIVRLCPRPQKRLRVALTSSARVIACSCVRTTASEELPQRHGLLHVRGRGHRLLLVAVMEARRLEPNAPASTSHGSLRAGMVAARTSASRARPDPLSESQPSADTRCIAQRALPAPKRSTSARA